MDVVHIFENIELSSFSKSCVVIHGTCFFKEKQKTTTTTIFAVTGIGDKTYNNEIYKDMVIYGIDGNCQCH